jgi:hypothetical protein
MTTTRSPVRELPPSRRRPSRLQGLVTRRRVVSSLLLALATAGLVAGFWDSEDGGGTTAQQRRPAAVIQVFPTEGAASLRQEPIGAQLADEYTGEIEVDGRPIPADQTERPPVASAQNAPAPRGLSGLNQVSFTPGPGKEIVSLRPGEHKVRILYWRKVGETRERAAAYSWSFTAS